MIKIVSSSLMIHSQITSKPKVIIIGFHLIIEYESSNTSEFVFR
jgi:hypothetical protein